MLCPVGAYTLIDRTLDRLINAGFSTSVNVHAHAEMLTEHVRDRAFVSVESPEALGTAGAIAKLRPWFAGRSVLAVNADTVSDADLGEIAARWDGESAMVAHTGPSFLPGCGVVASITPWSLVEQLVERPSGLYQTLWRPLHDRGRLQTVSVDCTLFDCGTPADLWRANMWATGGASSIGDDAVVLGRVEESVIFPGARVESGEFLRRAIRLASGTTVLIR